MKHLNLRKVKTIQLIAFTLLSFLMFGCTSNNSQKSKVDEYASMPTSTNFDIVLLNGRVMDPETNFDAIRNVGIKDGIIGLITDKDISGKETIDATGLVIAPGFIDGHQHCLEPYAHRFMVRDGRTTIMDLEVGAPGNQVAEFYKRIKGNTPINQGVSVSHEFARAQVLDGYKDWKYLHTPDAINSRLKQGWSHTRPTLEEGNQILQVVDEGLRQGGIGIGSTVGYMRDGVSSREIFELQRLGGLYGRQIGMHFRNTPGNDVEEVLGIQEMMANAAALGTPAIAMHFNNPGYNMVHELIMRMQDRGYNIWGELYPYNAGSTALNAVFLEPEVWEDKLGNEYEKTVMDVTTGKFITKEERKQIMKKDPTRMVVIFKMPESTIVDWMKLPGVAIGSDGMPLMPDNNLKWETAYEDFPNAHPRFAGSFAKVLRLARENNIPLMQAVAMTSYNSAKPLGDMGLAAMQERGRMQEGKIADITLFNPETVTDNSTFENGTVPSSGIPHVIVNGIIVMKDEEPLPRFDAGQAIRFEPMEEGLFQPLDKNHWTQEFYVLPKEEDFGGSAHMNCCDFEKCVHQ